MTSVTKKPVAEAAPRDSATAAPLELRLKDSRSLLEIRWDDGGCSRLSAALLRANSRSAGAIRAELERRAAPIADGLAITELRVIGNYAVNIVFSDGHDRAIFPWAYLRGLDEPSSKEPLSDEAFCLFR